MRHLKNIFLSLSAAPFLIALPSLSMAGANIILNNIDPPGVGFNDPTPAIPTGGNIGTTVGEQRLIAYQYALDLWGARLNSDPTIVVRGSFAGLNCEADTGTLASAGALQAFIDFPNAVPGVIYGVSLANALAGTDLSADPDNGVAPGAPDRPPFAGPPNDEIVARFNGNLGSPGCLEDSFWYYGLDSNVPEDGVDFLSTFMHEVAHGLGFQSFSNVSSGALLAGLPDIYTTLTFDTEIGLSHAEMTDEQRRASFISGNIIWTGDAVNQAAPAFLDNRRFIEITQPASIGEEIELSLAGFGPSASIDNFNGQVAIAIDEEGEGTTNDGCEPLINREEVAGKIALIDRGACSFTQKSLNAQNAGAIGVIIVNNTEEDGVVTPGGSSSAINIPVVGISQADGVLIKTESENGVFIQLSIDPSQLAGADALNRVKMNAPNPVQPGSSFSHFDPSASPNLLMEPSITDSLTAATEVDLTDDLFADLGWSVNSEPDLPMLSSDCDTAPNAIAFIDGCFTSVENRSVARVCHLSDVMKKQLDICLGAVDTFVDGFNCATQRFDHMAELGLITKTEGNILSGCAAGAIANNLNARRP